MKKRKMLLFLSAFLSIFLPIQADQTQSQVAPAQVNAAPPYFPSAQKAFEKIYAGTLSVEDAQTQPWFTSYNILYSQVNQGNSNPQLTAPATSSNPGILYQLQTQTVQPQAASAQFEALQQALISATNSVLVNASN